MKDLLLAMLVGSAAVLARTAGLSTPPAMVMAFNERGELIDWCENDAASARACANLAARFNIPSGEVAILAGVRVDD